MSEVLSLGGQIGAPAASPPPEPSALELEDILYDILASGADPSISHETLAAVQTFLHEHARSKRSQAEFLAFFAKHGLSTSKDNALTLSLPPLPLHPPAPPPPAPLAQEPEAIEVMPVQVQRKRQLKRGTLWACGGAVLAAISCGIWLLATQAWGEIDRVKAESRATADELARTRAELTSLRQKQEQDAERVQRVDHKSELLLQTFGSPLDPQQR
ncbi:MAG TPA: hypothetical protein VJR89_30375 [Polyangiales bacterium]|nr:hypothetical protein [Polyangiales bacterium]